MVAIKGKLPRVGLVAKAAPLRGRQHERGRFNATKRLSRFPFSPTVRPPTVVVRGGYELGQSGEGHQSAKQDGSVSREEEEGRERAQRSAVKSSWRRLILWSRVKHEEQERVVGKLEKQITKVSLVFLALL